MVPLLCVILVVFSAYSSRSTHNIVNTHVVGWNFLKGTFNHGVHMKGTATSHTMHVLLWYNNKFQKLKFDFEKSTVRFLLNN